MRLESLDGFGACPPKGNDTPEKKELTYLLPTSQLNNMGLVSTMKVLDEAQVPYTSSIVDGKPTYQVGKETVPGFLPIKSKDQIVASLKNNLTTDAKATDAVPTVAESMPTSQEKKALGIVSLAFLALAAVASALKSKPGAINGLGAPRKKIAVIQL